MKKNCCCPPRTPQVPYAGNFTPAPQPQTVLGVSPKANNAVIPSPVPTLDGTPRPTVPHNLGFFESRSGF